jgi:hypothetical protein
MSGYSLKPVAADYSTLAECLLARADEIDNRTGPIPGNVADRIARELRLAAEGLNRE